MNKELEVRCLHCKDKFNYYSSKFRPFCCERCKMVDLGQWFNGSYGVASESPLSEEDIDKVEEELNGKNED